MPFKGRSRGGRGRAIDRLAPERVTDDEFTWAWCLLPDGHRHGDRPARLASLLRRMPQLGYDPGLSLPLLYSCGLIRPTKLLETDFATLQRHWWGLPLRELLDEMKGALGAACRARALDPRAMTDQKSLPASETAERMKLRGRRRVPRPVDPASDRLHKSVADNSAIGHRRRINLRHDQTVAIVDMACGKVGDAGLTGTRAALDADATPVISSRVIERFFAKRQDFRDGAGCAVLAFFDVEAGRKAPKRLSVKGGLNARAMLAILKAHGLQEAIRRTTIRADAVDHGAAEDHAWNQAKTEALRRTWEADRIGLRAFSVTLKLRSGFNDLAHGVPCTPNDCSLLLRDIAHAALDGLRCAAAGTFDASNLGWPHLHLMVVIRADDAHGLEPQLKQAYRRRGMRPRRGDEGLFDLTEVKGNEEARWAYGPGKVNPKKLAGSLESYLGMVDDLADAKVDPRDKDRIRPVVEATRLAAWHQAHGITKTFSANLMRLAGAKALSQVASGVHPWVDGIVGQAAATGTPLSVAARAGILRALGFAPAVAAPTGSTDWQVGPVRSTPRQDLVDMMLEIAVDDPAISEFLDGAGSPVPAGSPEARSVRLRFQREHYDVMSSVAGSGRTRRVRIRQSRAVRRRFSDMSFDLVKADGAEKPLTIVARAAREAVTLSDGWSMDAIRAVYRRLAREEDERDLIRPRRGAGDVTASGNTDPAASSLANP